ncbi:MAG: LCP family protein [Alistipes sp.]|nr:LCP family protein [Alistipes sp.]
MKRFRKIILTAALILLLFASISTVFFLIMRDRGRKSLRENAIIASTVPSILEEETSAGDNAFVWQPGWVMYNGEIYRYNDDILTFLVMGIDSKTEVKEASDSVHGGQSDALLLIVMNPENKTVKLVNINRNVMTDIDIYNYLGEYVTTTKAQLAIQHGYGDGMEISCERTVKAVSNLFYGIPIHGYCAVNYVAIPTINDMAGGVTVTLLDDFTFFDKSMIKGTTMKLSGKQAFKYVQYRDTKVFNSVAIRMERIKQYLTALIGALKQKMKSDITVPAKLYEALSPYMVTNISLDEIIYLASEALSYDIDTEHFYSLEGETRAGEIYEEFYADEDYLYDLIIRLFYERVNQ